jgi:hypothetical protein
MRKRTRVKAYRHPGTGKVVTSHVSHRFTGRKPKRKLRGFRNVQHDIAKRQGISEERAGAILAASTRRASAGAKRRNPRLRRVR